MRANITISFLTEGYTERYFCAISKNKCHSLRFYSPFIGDFPFFMKASNPQQQNICQRMY